MKINLINQAITINPKVAAYYRNLGAAQYSLKNFEEAVKFHQKAIDIEP
jgi:tetratricopeptide (TPR) repeat protein